jgi:hypothetical protein
MIISNKESQACLKIDNNLEENIKKFLDKNKKQAKTLKELLEVGSIRTNYAEISIESDLEFEFFKNIYKKQIKKSFSRLKKEIEDIKRGIYYINREPKEQDIDHIEAYKNNVLKLIYKYDFR